MVCRVREVREQPARVIQHLGIVRIQMRQAERDVNRLAIPAKSGVDALQMESRHAAQHGIGGPRKRVDDRRQSLFIAAQLRQRHAEQHVDVRKVRLQTERLAKRRDRIGILPCWKQARPRRAWTSATPGVSFRNISNASRASAYRPSASARSPSAACCRTSAGSGC